MRACGSVRLFGSLCDTTSPTAAGELISQIKLTVMITPGGTQRLTGGGLINPALLRTTHQITDPSITATLSQPIWNAGHSKSKKKKRPAAGAGAKDGDMMEDD